MRFRSSWVVAVFAALLASGPARGQSVGLIEQAPPGPPVGVPVVEELAPEVTIEPKVLLAVPEWKVRFGFSYLRPYSGNGGLSLRAAGAADPSLAVIRPFGDLANEFAFVPRIDLQYNPADAGYAGAVAAQFINVTSNLERSVTLGTPTATDLLANYNLSLLIVDILQVTSREPLRLADLVEHPLVERLGRENDTFKPFLGTRFVSIRQTWSATLRGDPTFAASNANQTFAGLGLSAGLATDHPLRARRDRPGQWGLYSDNRVSLLIGPNNRKSVATGVGPGGPFNNTLVENRTTFVPAVEIELGVRYAVPDPKGGPEPRVWVRTGFVGHFWGGTGFLPAAAGDARFDNRSLFLVGVSVLVGGRY